MNRSIPPVFSSSDVRTVTPQTITITPQGMRLDRGFSSATLASVSTTAAANAPMPDVDPETDDTDHQKTAMVPSVTQCQRSPSSRDRVESAIDWWSSSSATKQSPAAEGEITHARGERVRREVIQGSSGARIPTSPCGPSSHWR